MPTSGRHGWYDASQGYLDRLENLINRLDMDILAPLISHLSLSVSCYFSGRTCEGGEYDDTIPVGHLHIIKGGGMDVTLRGGEAVRIDQPSALFLPRPTVHVMTPLPGGVELVCGTVDLGLTEKSPLAASLPAVLVIPIADLPAIGPTLDLLFEEAFGMALGRQSAIDRLMEYFVVLVLRHLVARGDVSQGSLAAMADPRLCVALSAMHERPAHPWTLDELANVASMSRARFAARFRELAGCPPLEYLTDWRLAIARRQLRQGRALKSVAHAVGYQSPEALTRVFVRKTGLSPARWAKENR